MSIPIQTNRKNSKNLTLFYVFSSAAFVLLLQIMPLLLLSASNYGYYSIIQLILVLASSISVSLINEADVRSISKGNDRSTWDQYSSITIWLCILFSVLTFIISSQISELSAYSLFWAAGIGFALYRATVRYRLTQEGKLKRLVSGDLVSIISMIVSLSIVGSLTRWEWDLSSVLIVWFVGQFSGILFTKIPQSLSPKLALAWVTTRRSEISALLPDSALQDVGAFWAPNFIGLILDVASLGIFRAITTLSAPVRLILTPLRPLFTKGGVAKIHSTATFFILCTMGTLLGFSVSLFLILIDRKDIQLGVFTELTPFVLPISIYLAGNLLNFFYGIQARITLPTRRLLSIRVLQASLLGVLPVLFAFNLGVTGAIWAIAFGHLSLGIVWFLLTKVQYDTQQK